MAAADASEKPYKGLQYEHTFPIVDTANLIKTGAASLDTEVSGDGGTFADGTNETTEIATNSGMYKHVLTAAEMNFATVTVIVKSDQVTTPIVLYTSSDVIERGTAQAGAANNAIKLRASPRLAAANDFFNGHRVRIIDGTGEGQERIIIDYVHTGVTCTVERVWGNNPDATSVYEIFSDDISTFDTTGATLTAIPETDVNVVKINATTIVGDGSGTPFNV